MNFLSSSDVRWLKIRPNKRAGYSYSNVATGLLISHIATKRFHHITNNLDQDISMDKIHSQLYMGKAQFKL